MLIMQLKSKNILNERYKIFLTIFYDFKVFLIMRKANKCYKMLLTNQKSTDFKVFLIMKVTPMDDN